MIWPVKSPDFLHCLYHTSVVAVSLIKPQYSLAARQEMSCVLEQVEADLVNATAADHARIPGGRGGECCCLVKADMAFVAVLVAVVGVVIDDAEMAVAVAVVFVMVVTVLLSLFSK